MIKPFSSGYYKLLIFSILISFITYGFALSNFSLSIDSEQVFSQDYVLNLGRWGTTLFRYYIFGGITPYFSLLLGLIFLSLASVEVSKLFRLGGLAAYVFCGLFLTFPQMAYQLVFTMQSDVLGCGFLTGALAVSFFLKSINGPISLKSAVNFTVSALLFMFTIALNQSLAMIPVIIFTIILFQNTFYSEYSFKGELKKFLLFVGLCVSSVLFYYLSVKILCPPGAGLADYYTSGTSDTGISGFLKLWFTNLAGNSYYGAKTFIVATVAVLILLVRFIIWDRKHFAIRALLLTGMLLLPFFMSFFITNGYHPPRLYVASGIVFGFIIMQFASTVSFSKLSLNLVSLIAVANIYFITMLFWSQSKIYNHDINIAKNIDQTIKTKYPDFDPTKDYVYFYGGLPFEEHDKFRVPRSEVFGGSFFSWDGGSNHRITGFMKFTDVAYYKVIDNPETFNKMKDSIAPMPLWPKDGYIKRVDNVIIVRLGQTKGAPLWGVEM
ncbi:glucosyltransferase domain-containing protein [Flavobacterium sp. DGU11]|uniref:Glucosyltransferase domain-containing protein n=1 Tax=Flavobacterium arundinis TaxID=3139143 RepID=A0ABU9I2I0_9FLAO